MKNVFIRGLIVASILSAGPGMLIGCDHEEHSRTAGEAHRRDQESTAPSGGDVAHARDSIVSARCDREERCANIGSGKDYENRAACNSKLQGKTGSDLNLEDCSRGVDQPKLSECLSKIRDESCGNPIDSLSRFAACRTGAVCIGS